MKSERELVDNKEGEKVFYPGTVVETGNLSGEQFIEEIFRATGGLYMKQLNEITGIATPTLQNWVTRGFIAHPENKRYSKQTVARIFIINMLRRTMALEDIRKLLVYVNGNAEDRADDIIEENVLYAYVCRIAFDENFSYKTLSTLVDNTVSDYSERFAGAARRLNCALNIICLNYLAGQLQSKSEKLIGLLKEENIFGVKV